MLEEKEREGKMQMLRDREYANKKKASEEDIVFNRDDIYDDWTINPGQ